ncbi:MAG: histidine phosphatase family protein [Planctomycetota bacterium]|nr:histidine phosphatase family protein [Planctomycetota bacterium]
MDLYLIRHAEALLREQGGSDEKRPLSAKGRRRFVRVVAGLERIGVRFDRVLFSPHLRAQETAELALTLCDGESEVVLELARSPDELLLTNLRALTFARVALIGHEPWLSQLATQLMLGQQVSASNRVQSAMQIDKGGVVHLSGEIGSGAMTLIAAHPPDVLRKIRR